MRSQWGTCMGRFCVAASGLVFNGLFGWCHHRGWLVFQNLTCSGPALPGQKPAQSMVRSSAALGGAQPTLRAQEAASRCSAQCEFYSRVPIAVTSPGVMGGAGGFSMLSPKRQTGESQPAAPGASFLPAGWNFCRRGPSPLCAVFGNTMGCGQKVQLHVCGLAETGLCLQLYLYGSALPFHAASITLLSP